MKKIFKSRNDRPSEKRTEPEINGTNVIFGVKPVVEALRSNTRRIERLLIASGANQHRMREILELARAAGTRIDRVSTDAIVRITGRDANHQGVVIISAAADYADADKILSNLSEKPLLLLLDGVEDPRNLGAILRTAECAGVDGVFLPERRAVGLTETVSKSAAGATEHINVAKVANLNNLIAELKKQNLWVVGTSVDAKTDHTEWDWNRPTALVVGGEGKGLHRLIAENCDLLVKIPMYGKIDSLNVSVAAGVILFEARRQRSVNNDQANS